MPTLNNCLRYLVILFNTCIGLGGVALIAIGAYIRQSDYRELEPDIIDAASSYLIGIGVVVFLFALVGCIGACKQHRATLCIYMGLLVGLIAAQIYAANIILSETDSLEDARDGGSVGYDDTEEKLRDNFNTLYEAAQNSTTGEYDWLLDFVDDHCTINDDDVESPYDQCRYEVLDLMLEYVGIMGYAVVGVGGAQLLLLLMSCCLCCYHKSESPEERLNKQRELLFGETADDRL